MNLHPYQLSISIIILGSVMYSLGIVISYLLIALRKTFVQAIVYVAVSIFATITSYLFVRKFSILGASITYLLTMTSIAISFFLYLFYYLKKLKIEWEEEK